LPSSATLAIELSSDGCSERGKLMDKPKKTITISEYAKKTGQTVDQVMKIIEARKKAKDAMDIHKKDVGRSD
jgi:hypothetical protein